MTLRAFDIGAIGRYNSSARRAAGHVLPERNRPWMDCMISPNKYVDMISAGEKWTMLMADSTPEAMSMMSDADRLEAAVDTAILLCAEDGDGFDDDGDLCFNIELRHLRYWLGTGSSWCKWDKWDWRKDRIVSLFRREVAGRYTVGGWETCRLGYGYPQSQHIWFEFRGRGGRGATKHTMADKNTDPDVRMAFALDDLGEILGLGYPSAKPDDRNYKESLAGYLESLRVRARMMRFDLEATRREARQPVDPDDMEPPFEGSPDDENFGDS